MHSFEDAKLQGRERHSESKTGGDVDINDREQHTQGEPSATTGKEPKTSKSGNSVLSGPNKNIMDSTKDGPFRSTKATGANAKLGPKRSNKSKQTPYRKYYIPPNDTKTFQVNSQGHLQCHQDPNLIHKPNDKGNCQTAERHQSTMN